MSYDHAWPYVAKSDGDHFAIVANRQAAISMGRGQVFRYPRAFAVRHMTRLRLGRPCQSTGHPICRVRQLQMTVNLSTATRLLF